MNLSVRTILFISILLATGIIMIPTPLLAQEVTVTGEINEDGKLVVSSGEVIYTIAEDEIGNRLTSQHRGNKVRVVGQLLRQPDSSSIDRLPTGLIQVTSYEDLAE